MKKILILGANGFIGQHLARHLAGLGQFELTLFSRTISNSLKAIEEEYTNVNILKGDFNDILDLVPVVRGQDIVYHLISTSVPSTSWERPGLEIKTNLIPSVNLLKLCADLQVKKLAFISSGGTVYGKQNKKVVELDRLQPFSPYGIVKATIESFLEYFLVKDGMEYDVYRLTNPYGPGLEKLNFGVINTWLSAAQRDKPIRVFGDGTSQKDYIYIDDAVRLISHSAISETTGSNIFNVSSGEISSLNRILEVIESITGKKLDAQYIKATGSDNSIVNLDNSKILQQFSDFKFTTLPMGIKATWLKMTELLR